MMPGQSNRHEGNRDAVESRPFVDPHQTPFVGNETVDDNIAECAQLAIWSALRGQRSNVSVNVADGTATLAGTAQSEAQRQAIAEAVALVKGVDRVANRIRIARLRPLRTQLAPRAAALALEQIAARPMLYVVRYCVLDEASISAAMRQAVPTLENALATRGAPPMRELIVVYRNRVPGAVTVEIGVPADLRADATIDGEPALGMSPGGAMISRVADAGLQGLVRREADLAATARAAGLEAASFFWQSFTRDQARAWNGHPQARVFLPIIPHTANRQVAPSGVPQ